MVNPYQDQHLTTNSRIRTFEQNVPEEELVWHRDSVDRTVRVIECDRWMFQRDNQLPFLLHPGTVIEIPANEFHRLIKGSGSLVLSITENHN
jgi:quercetin dioxygenase-like cupin family protein